MSGCSIGHRATIYVATHGHKKILFKSNAQHVIVLGGADSIETAQPGWLEGEFIELDNTGENISRLNPYWSELTVWYWILKNTKDTHIGLCHYRRNWDEDYLFSESAEVLHAPKAIKLPNGETLEQNFRRVHPAVDLISAAKKLASSGGYPLSHSQLEYVFQLTHIRPCLMLVGPRHFVASFMELLFDCLWPIWNESYREIESLYGYNARAISFFAERIFTGLFALSSELFPHIPIQFGGARLIPILPTQPT